MSDVDDVSGLEVALMERARKLSEGHLLNGRQARDLILLETRQRLRLEEERETAAAKAQGERVYQQRIQAVELDIRARARPPALATGQRCARQATRAPVRPR